MMRIVLLDGFVSNPGDLSWDTLYALGEVTVYDRTPTAEVVERAREADAVLTNKVRFTADIMDRLPRLRYIGVLATGYNVVDLEAASARGIVVTNIPAYSTPSVAQMVFAHLLHITARGGSPRRPRPPGSRSPSGPCRRSSPGSGSGLGCLRRSR